MESTRPATVKTLKEINRRKVTKNENSYDLAGLRYCKLSRYLCLKFWNRGPIYFISVTWLDEGKKNDQKLGCNKDGQ